MENYLDRIRGAWGSMERQMIDIHCHLVPGVDDGAASTEMAMEMLRLSAQQGIAGVFATPHSSAFDLWGDEAWEQFLRLKARAGQLFPELAARFRELGCFIQINAYSVAEEKDPAIRQRARRLLEQKLVDFLGTDAHRTGHRPPIAEMGLRWLHENCEEDYAYAVIRGSAERLLMN